MPLETTLFIGYLVRSAELAPTPFIGMRVGSRRRNAKRDIYDDDALCDSPIFPGSVGVREESRDR